MRKTLRWLRSHKKTTTLILFVAFMAALNGLAYRHAYAMTHLVATDQPVVRDDQWTYSHTIGDRAALLISGVTLYRQRNHRDPSSVGLPFTVHDVPGDLGKLEAWYIPHEQPRGIVLLFHGYTGCKRDLLPEAKAFHEMEYSCFLVDFPGSGGSDGDVTTLGYREADDVAKCVEYVQQHWPNKPIILFGQSMGSSAILRAVAVHGVAPAAAVLECPFDRMTATIAARFSKRGLPSFPGTQLLVFWGGAQNGFNGFGHNPVDYANDVTCPVLLLHGSKDPTIDQPRMQTIYDNLKGEKKLHFFEGLGHEPYQPKAPAEWKTAVWWFLKDKT